MLRTPRSVRKAIFEFIIVHLDFPASIPLYNTYVLEHLISFFLYDLMDSRGKGICSVLDIMTLECDTL